MRILLGLVLFAAPLLAQTYRPTREKPPRPTREFRAAWVAVVHNIDWPSRKGLSATAQRRELTALLDKMAALHMNAVILQVRPHADAVYSSRHEPWSHWLTGTMGNSPGYDPLQFCVAQAHRRGIEVHAWFNPYRALTNADQPASRDHVTRSAPQTTKRYGGGVWCDPAHPETRRRTMTAILDVVRRYDIDGVHLDDYFYPYPKGGRNFPDGRSPAERRRTVDQFVATLYSQVKSTKPWMRVGISPFGIWRPGVPDGIEAGLDAYEQLACDARKWLAKGWVDYLAPQLYWRDSPPKQSFSTLLGWWRAQGQRPVWPGIATSRIQSSEDPGRPASEILRQVELSRRIGRNYVGQIHWSMKALMQNRDGIATDLTRGAYSTPALVPPMPWMGKRQVARPRATVRGQEDHLGVTWKASDPGTAKLAVMGRIRGRWTMLAVLPKTQRTAKISTGRVLPELVSLSAVDRFGNLSAPVVLGR